MALFFKQSSSARQANAPSAPRDGRLHLSGAVEMQNAAALDRIFKGMPAFASHREGTYLVLTCGYQRTAQLVSAVGKREP